MADEVVEAVVVEPSTDVATVEHHPAGLFNTDDPVEVIEKASKVASALKALIDKQGLVSNIQGREHVRVEGWTALGSMLGVVPVVVWTKETEDGWEARVEARTMDGRVVGAAEAMCTRKERTWAKRDPYALRSMCQTRAVSKALRGPLGFVVTLAGYEATPFEEMPAETAHSPRTDVASDITPPLVTNDQLAALRTAFAAAGNPVEQVGEWLNTHGGPPGPSLKDRMAVLPAALADELLAWLRDGGA